VKDPKKKKIKAAYLVYFANLSNTRKLSFF